jgi:energy-converting hydrogenase Eha subunit G
MSRELLCQRVGKLVYSPFVSGVATLVCNYGALLTERLGGFIAGTALLIYLNKSRTDHEAVLHVTTISQSTG